MKYIDFNDLTIPLGKRKQAYIKWAVSKGTCIEKAKIQANKKFGFEKKEGILVFIIDHGRLGQYSFTEEEDVYGGYNLRKYKNKKWILVNGYSLSDEEKQIMDEYKKRGWDVFTRTCCG